ncbi:colanic acid biosynthesis glycosyltransferase WcaL [Aliigemmobacter aestuarii]|uniref:Colanic acid biosynthesis glycosyltransferase WcaL n=1 Tax=Aliigemmobacter aestuarii TaxID=1445661 RepID=A0A4S3MR05_9RHOB|nr:glycosyltransferase [Gemmobacter aestuarii]THD83841.1 colanic acid biosynthesis glycosyltransferase WcaL [Gemmobacter aestuarii]
MKIAYLVNTYPRASHSFIRREIRALERRGLSVHRLAMRSDRAALVDTEDLDEDARTEHVLKLGAARLAVSALGWMSARPAKAWTAARLAWRMGVRANHRLRHLIYLAEAAHVAKRCADLGIDHLHAHFGTNSATVAALAHALGGSQFSFTVHGPEEFDAPLALSLGDKIERAAFVVAISSFGRSQLCRWVASSHWPRIRVVHCGIEPARFPEPAQMPQTPRLVAIGRFSEQKGFPLLVAAMAEAAPRLPGLHLTLVGDGPLRETIGRAIADQGLTDRITLTGWLDEAGVRDQLARAQALILPSFAEGLPVVVMEALAAGRPVIATAIAGVPELVTPGCGWLVPAGDAHALATAIREFAATPAARLAEMGRHGRERVFARHDIDHEAARLARLFEGTE